MKIGMFGTGYVGLTTGTCLADLGNDVVCYDVDTEKIAKLKNGSVPFYEPGLKELIERNVKEKRLIFTNVSTEAVLNAEVIFIAVGTPDKNGTADLTYLFKAAEEIAKNMEGYKVIVIKSTVPVCTSEKIGAYIKKITKHESDMVSNPEFLREGEAIKDFMNPDRVVIGINSGIRNDKAKDIMVKIYKGIERVGKPIVITDIKSAELIKYASNAMLAARISFMNQLTCLCEKVGADIKEVAKGIGLDARIGPRFLQAGIGYGGSCFPKDVRALAATMREQGCESELLDAIEAVNERQKVSLIPKIEKCVGTIKGKTIGILGLSFKPKTDDMRDAPSLIVIQELRNRGAKIKMFDPVAMENAKKYFSERDKGYYDYCKNAYDAAKGSDCLVIVTEWDEFRYLDKEKLKQAMKTPIIIDGRNIYDPDEMRELGFIYVSMGR